MSCCCWEHVCCRLPARMNPIRVLLNIQNHLGPIGDKQEKTATKSETKKEVVINNIKKTTGTITLKEMMCPFLFLLSPFTMCKTSFCMSPFLRRKKTFFFFTRKSMREYLKYLKGDSVIWIIAILMLAFSLVTVYSFVPILIKIEGGSPFKYLYKHFIYVVLAFFSMYCKHPFLKSQCVSLPHLPLMVGGLLNP